MRICDRCGTHPCAEHLQCPVHQTDHDLCAECYAEFELFVAPRQQAEVKRPVGRPKKHE